MPGDNLWMLIFVMLDWMLSSKSLMRQHMLAIFIWLGPCTIMPCRRICSSVGACARLTRRCRISGSLCMTMRLGAMLSIVINQTQADSASWHISSRSYSPQYPCPSWTWPSPWPIAQVDIPISKKYNKEILLLTVPPPTYYEPFIIV